MRQFDSHLGPPLHDPDFNTNANDVTKIHQNKYTVTSASYKRKKIIKKKVVRIMQWWPQMRVKLSQ